MAEETEFKFGDLIEYQFEYGKPDRLYVIGFTPDGVMVLSQLKGKVHPIIMQPTVWQYCTIISRGNYEICRRQREHFVGKNPHLFKPLPE